MKTLGCIQSSYLPWPGYFHLIRRSDVFVFHDDIAYTKQDWRNRNRIKSASGVKWITAPVRKETTRGNIEDVLISDTTPWQLRHGRMIEAAYRAAPYYGAYREILEEAYRRPWSKLSDLNIWLIRQLCGAAGIRTQLLRSSELEITGRKTDRLIQMCRRLGASRYVSGPSAKGYIEIEKFENIGVQVDYMKYDYPPYPQLHGDFVPQLSMIDLLFNCGPDCGRFVWGTPAAGGGS